MELRQDVRAPNAGFDPHRIGEPDLRREQQLFDKADNAKPKNQKSLRTAGQFLADNEFGIAVVVVTAGGTGDAQKDLAKLKQLNPKLVSQLEYAINNKGQEKDGY